MVAQLELQRIPVLPGAGMSDDNLPVLFTCPTCGRGINWKVSRYASAWELLNGRTYPNQDRSVPCEDHEAA